jgi:methylphosphotriester-DNA--protein-cysteine methyltransferase
MLRGWTRFNRAMAIWQARRTLAYIEANLSSKVDIDDLENVVASSRSHFSRAFKHSIGMPPMEYVVVNRESGYRAARSGAIGHGSRPRGSEVRIGCVSDGSTWVQ